MRPLYEAKNLPFKGKNKKIRPKKINLKNENISWIPYLKRDLHQFFSSVNLYNDKQAN